MTDKSERKKEAGDLGQQATPARARKPDGGLLRPYFTTARADSQPREALTAAYQQAGEVCHVQ